MSLIVITEFGTSFELQFSRNLVNPVASPGIYNNYTVKFTKFNKIFITYSPDKFPEASYPAASFTD